MKNRLNANHYKCLVVGSLVTLFFISCSCGGPTPVVVDSSKHSIVSPPVNDSSAHLKDTMLPKIDDSATHRPEPRQTKTNAMPKLDSTASHRPEPRQTKQ